MRRIVSNQPKKEDQEPVQSTTPDPVSADIDLDDLYDKTKLIMYREIKNLLRESSGKLLSKDHSQSLVNYARLLKDLRKEERERLSGLSPEELEKLKQDEGL